MSKTRFVELEAEGESYVCEVLEIFEVGEKSYAFLMNVATEDLVMMHLIETDKGAVFRVIESDEEFDRVTSYAKAVLSGEC